MALRLPLLPPFLRWGAVGVVAAAIGFWSSVAPPPVVVADSSLVVLADRGLEVASRPQSPAVSSTPSFRTTLALDPTHVCAYVALGLTVAHALVTCDLDHRRKAAAVVLLVTVVGAFAEAGQLFLATRTASLGDVASNATGAVVSCSWYGLEGRSRFVPVRELLAR